MKRIRLLIIAIVSLSSFQITYCQSIHPAIDTTNESIRERISFIRSYFQMGEEHKEKWHPKYADYSRFNFSTLIDGLTRNKTPNELLEKYEIRINELEELNDTLTYFKYEINAAADCHIVEYKLYLVEIDGQFFIDNCKDYEKYRFEFVQTPNISFYISPWYDFEIGDLMEASNKMDSLYRVLGIDRTMPQVENFLCSSIEEMNVLTNMNHFYGYVGGFTEMEHNFIVAHNDDPFYLHEFIHVMLGSSASGKNFILGEGVASYLGGISKETSYQNGLEYLNACFETGRCNFDLLYQRKIYNPRDNIPSYAFAAILCSYIIEKFGMNYFLKLYNDPEVSDDTLIRKLETDKGVSKDDIVQYVHRKVHYNN